MTARDDAIDAMLNAVLLKRYNAGSARYINALDAIPGDVLVRLAIERGALEEIGYIVASRGEFIANEGWEPRYRGLVFRVVEP